MTDEPIEGVTATEALQAEVASLRIELECWRTLSGTPEDNAATISGLRAERDDWHKLADERSAEIVRLTAAVENYALKNDELERALKQAREELHPVDEAQSNEATALARVAELEAELRQYEPSDGVMQQRLAMTEAIREAAALLQHCADAKEWFALPAVVAARKEPG